MTDKEILNVLYDIKPADYRQWEKLKKCILIWMDDKVDHTDEYVGMLTDPRVVDRPCAEVYEEYVEWCKVNYITDIVHINAFGKYLNYYLKVKSKAINGRRYYCK